MESTFWWCEIVPQEDEVIVFPSSEAILSFIAHNGPCEVARLELTSKDHHTVRDAFREKGPCAAYGLSIEPYREFLGYPADGGPY